MKKGYLFIANDRKRGEEFEASLAPIKTGTFEKSSIAAANEVGYKLYQGINRLYPEKIKSEDYEIEFYNQHIYRNIFNIKEIYKGYRNLCNFLKIHEDIEIIHCNTPIGGVLGRLAGTKFNKKVVYMAHGFHFYKGAPLFNRIFLKSIEKWLAHKTDVLITINEEDYQNALKFKLKPRGRVYKVSGVGMDIENYSSIEIDYGLRKSIGVENSDFICISLGDLNKNKNYTTVIDAISKTKSKDIHYLICGLGPLEHKLKRQVIRLGLEKQVHFLGFRSDGPQLMGIADCTIISSFREGLPRTTMEAMASGLPCIVSDIRGNRDLIEDGKGGFLVDPKSPESFAKSILKLKRDKDLCKKMSEWNLSKIKDFSLDTVKSQILEIFKTL